MQLPRVTAPYQHRQTLSFCVLHPYSNTDRFPCVPMVGMCRMQEMVITTHSNPKLLSPLLSSTPTALKCSLTQKAAASIWMALGKGWGNKEGGKTHVYCTVCRQDKAHWNNLQSELLGARPAALHLLTLPPSSRQISARRAELGDDGEESGGLGEPAWLWPIGAEKLCWCGRLHLWSELLQWL